MRLDVYIHLPRSIELWMETFQETIMATQAEILAKLDETNASLDGIQLDITALKALVDSGADLTAISDAVNALAAKASGIDLQTP